MFRRTPSPKIPGRPDRKYFVGLPIPGAAALVAAVVYACDGEPLRGGRSRWLWLALLLLLGFLMVSTWRYYSFKGMNLRRPLHAADHDPARRVDLRDLELLAAVLLAMAACYVASGIAIRIGGILRRRLRHAPQSRRTGASNWLDIPHCALVGSESLMGRELRDLVATSRTRVAASDRGRRGGSPACSRAWAANRPIVTPARRR